MVLHPGERREQGMVMGACDADAAADADTTHNRSSPASVRSRRWLARCGTGLT